MTLCADAVLASPLPPIDKLVALHLEATDGIRTSGRQIAGNFQIPMPEV